jgi:hypothetical protein
MEVRLVTGDGVRRCSADGLKTSLEGGDGFTWVVTSAVRLRGAGVSRLSVQPMT